MAKRVDIADRLKALGVDPVEGLTRIAAKAERLGNDALAAKVYGELLQYTAPKLKTVEHAIEAGTRDFLDAQQRQQRIRELAAQTGLTDKLVRENDPARPLTLLHVPDDE